MVSLQSSDTAEGKREDSFYLGPRSDDQPVVRAPLILGLLAAAAGTARAGVVVGEGVPFTADELAAAIEARGGEAGGEGQIDVEVERSSGAELRLITEHGTWQVAVGEASGAVAARLVALHVVGDRLGAIDLPPAAPPRRVAVGPSQAPYVDDLDEPTAAGGDDSPAGVGPWLTFRTGATRGTAGTDLAAFVGSIELGGERERWIAAGEIGVHLSGASSEAGDVRWVVPHGRLLLGRRVGTVEALGSVLLGQMFLSNVEDRPSATMVAVGGIGRMVLPVGHGPWRFVAGVGVDAYQNRIVIRRVGVEHASTPRFALSATLGLSMVMGR
jgi:hypothetical protein